MNIELLASATLDTLLMSLISVTIAYLLGVPLGVLLSVSIKKGIKPNKTINLVFGTIVNILRSIPCLFIAHYYSNSINKYRLW